MISSFLMKPDQRGAIPLLVLIGVVGVISVLFISSVSPFKDGSLFGTLFSKPSSFAAEKDLSELVTNELLVKVRQDSRSQIKENPGDTGKDSLNKKFKEHKVKKFERIAKAGKKSKVDSEIFGWYKVTFEGKSENIKGKFDNKTGKLESSDSRAAGIQRAINDLLADPNIEAVEPNFVAKVFQTPPCVTSLALSVEKPTNTGAPGQTISNTLYVTNNSSSSCGPATISQTYPLLLTPVLSSNSVTVNPGETASVPFTVAISNNTVANSYDHYLWLSNYGQGSVLHKVIVDPNYSPTPTASPTPTPSALPSVAPTPDTQPPTAPSNLVVTSTTSRAVNLNWGASTDNDIIVAYRVYRNSQFIVSGNVLSYTDSNLTPGTAYNYYVVAQDRTANLSPASNTVTATTQPGPTPLPILSHEPNDPYYASVDSWGNGQPDLWGVRKINAGDAWKETTGSSQVIVADIDTGVDYNHEDIRDRMWVNSAETANNGIDDDGNGYIDDYLGWDFFNNDKDPMDDHSHGTHTVGTIAASTNNGIGVAGVSWNAKIMPLKFIGAGNTGPLTAAAAALIYAADMGAQVSSNSWGCWGCQSLLIDDAIKYEHDRGMTIVVAAGNSNSDALDSSPASSSRVITVGATDANDNRSVFWSGYASNWGQKIDVTAPGSDVLSLKSSLGSGCTAADTVGTSYCRKWGTSMAAPHVSGLVALLLSKNQSLTNEQIRQILRNSAVDLGQAGKDMEFGFGRIDAAKTLQNASSLPLTPIITSPADRLYVASPTLTIYGSAAGANFASYKVEIGAGRSPTAWKTAASSTTPVVNGALATINTLENLTVGQNTIKLSAADSAGKIYQYQVFDINFSNVFPSATPTPVPSPSPSPTPLPSPSATPRPSPSPSPTPTPDTTPPNVSITSPANNVTVKRNGRVAVRVSATDNVAVGKVDIYINNNLLCSDDTAPYSCNWRVPNARNAQYTVLTQAFDKANNSSTASISVRAN